MAKRNKPTFSATIKPSIETAMEKTTRVAREMLDTETEKRQARTSRLRKARLEREAGTPDNAITTKINGVQKKLRAKNVTPT
jgi:hypothetical protein